MSKPKKIIDDLARWFNQYNYTWLNRFKFKESKNIKEFSKDFILRLFHINNWLLDIFRKSKRILILNIKELSSIIHFPHSRFNKNPRISFQNYKMVAAPENLPDEWILLGWNTYWGIKKEVRFTTEDRFRHLYVIGQTGTGKSTLLIAQAVEDMKAWNGFCILDPHGELCDYVMDRFPKDKKFSQSWNWSALDYLYMVWDDPLTSVLRLTSKSLVLL
jgi:DNA helicase HerA-like ATPase